MDREVMDPLLDEVMKAEECAALCCDAGPQWCEVTELVARLSLKRHYVLFYSSVFTVEAIFLCWSKVEFIFQVTAHDWFPF